jgi:glycerol kinase
VSVPVTAVVADQQSALIGQGCEAPGLSKVTYGTSATYDVSTGADFRFLGPAIPPFVTSSVLGDTRFCIEGMVYAAGSALDWLRRTLRLGDHRRFTHLAGSVPDSGGRRLPPRAPGPWRPPRRPRPPRRLVGLSSATTAAHIARAALEGIAFRVRELVDHVEAATDLSRPAVLRADGGLAANDLLMQLQADLLGRPVIRHAHLEATAVGAALCAGRGAGLLGAADTTAFVRHAPPFEPRLSQDEADARFAAWKALVYGAAR